MSVKFKRNQSIPKRMKSRVKYVIYVVFALVLVQGCDDNDVKEMSGNLKTVVFEKVVDGIFTDTVRMKIVQTFDNNRFVETMKKCLETGTFALLATHMDSAVALVITVGERGYSGSVASNRVVVTLNELADQAQPKNIIFYRSNEDTQDGSMVYSLVLDGEEMTVNFGFVVLNGKINAIFIY